MTKALKLQSAKETIIVTQKELKDKYGEKVRNIYLSISARRYIYIYILFKWRSLF